MKNPTGSAAGSERLKPPVPKDGHFDASAQEIDAIIEGLDNGDIFGDVSAIEESSHRLAVPRLPLSDAYQTRLETVITSGDPHTLENLVAQPVEEIKETPEQEQTAEQKLTSMRVELVAAQAEIDRALKAEDREELVHAFARARQLAERIHFLENNDQEALRRAFEARRLIAESPGGRLELVKKLGKGGMAEVYVGRRLSHSEKEFRATGVVPAEREVAVKLLSRLTPSLRARFAREAFATAQIQHENVVKVFDVDSIEKDGIQQDAIVYELVRGGDLDARLYQRRQDVFKGDLESLSDLEQVVGLDLLQIFRGLAAVHEKGFVHRDIKPANIFVEPYESGDVLKVADLGIVRLLETQEDEDIGGQLLREVGELSRAETVEADSLDKNTHPLAKSAKLRPAQNVDQEVDDTGRVLENINHPQWNKRATTGGMVVGTPQYGPPEQFTGDEPNPSWDVYATAVVGYEYLTNATPFQGRTPIEVMTLKVTQEPPPIAEQLKLDTTGDPMISLIETLLRKKPKDRKEFVFEGTTYATDTAEQVEAVLALVLATRFPQLANNRDIKRAPEPTIILAETEK